jgi:hypothetical protein
MVHTPCGHLLNDVLCEDFGPQTLSALMVHLLPAPRIAIGIKNLDDFC